MLLLAPVVSYAGESPPSSEDGDAEFNVAVQRALTDYGKREASTAQNWDIAEAGASSPSQGQARAKADVADDAEADVEAEANADSNHAVPDNIIELAIQRALSGEASDSDDPAPAEDTDPGAAADPTIKVAVYVNGHWHGYSWLRINEHGHPCAEIADWLSWGVTPITRFVQEDDTQNPYCMIPQRLPKEQTVKPADDDDDDDDDEDAAQLHYDKLRQQLTVRVDSSLMSRSRGNVPAWRLAYGIPAVRFDYQLNGAQNTGNNFSDAQRHATLYGAFDLGANLGPWRFRTNHTYSRETTGKPSWERIATYLQRDIVPWRSKLLIGEGSTDSLLFDSMPFAGVQLMSEDNLLPDYLAAFTPVVRGIAKSTAEVSVRQHGLLFYHAVVAPGTFALYDVRPPSSSGDLNVTVREADGTEHTSIVPYIAMPLLVHNKVVKYAINFGRYRRTSLRPDFTQPEFVQATVGMGLPYRISTFAGVLNARGYRSLAAGVGWDLAAAGALSLDVTRSNVKAAMLTDTPNGNRIRVRYAKSFASTGTGINLDFRRYVGGHFRSLEDVLQRRVDIDTYRDLFGEDSDGLFDGGDIQSWVADPSPRTRIRLDMQQNVGDTGNVYATLSDNSFGGKQARMQSFQLGGTWYGDRFDVDTQVGLKRRAGTNSVSFQVNLSIPLALKKPNQTMRYAATVTRDDDGALTWGNQFSGSALRDYRLNYTLNQQQSKAAGTEGNASASYQADAARMDAGYGQGKGYRKVSLGVSGSVVGYKNGVVFGQNLGDTIAIVDAPGYPDASVDGQLSTRTDSQGRAIISYLTPYRINRLGLDSLELGEGLDYHTLFREVAPVSGAVIYVPIKPQPLVPIKPPEQGQSISR